MNQDTLLLEANAFVREEAPHFAQSDYFARRSEEGLDLGYRLERVAHLSQRLNGPRATRPLLQALRLVLAAVTTAQVEAGRLRGVEAEWLGLTREQKDLRIAGVLTAHRDQLAAERHGRIDALVADLRAHPVKL